jgi:Ca2+-binding EF-hand superfamily protein
MPKPLSILLVVGALFALPANAQNTQRTTADQKQCSDQFKAADLNNDGVLSRTEIGNAKQTLPSSLANQDRITRKQFMAVCSKGASKS